MSIFAETLSICAAGVPLASAPSLRTIFEISSLLNPWHVTAARRLFATYAGTFLPDVVFVHVLKRLWHV
jgi:hypothetical protein